MDCAAIWRVLLSGGGSGADRLPGQDAELVALGITERDPAAATGSPVAGQLRRPEREDPLSLLLPGAVCRPQVQVDPVLHHLATGDGDEEHKLAPVPRHDQALLVSWLVRVVRVFDEVQNLRPEDRCAWASRASNEVCGMRLVMAALLIARAEPSNGFRGGETGRPAWS